MNLERFESLFDAWAESRLTPAEAAELSALLRADPAARKRFREAAAFHGHLHAALDGLNLDKAVTPTTTMDFPRRSRVLSLVAMLLGVALTVASFGWALASRSNQAESRPLEIHDGGFDLISGKIPDGFPARCFAWGGDPSEITHEGDHPTALRFLEAAGEPTIPNSPRQSCDVFQIVDLRSVRGQLLTSGEAYAELTVSLRDARPGNSEPVRFISKVYVFEGSPTDIIGHWPPVADQTLGSGAQFRLSRGGREGEWRPLITRCVLPPTAGFLVVQIGAGSAGEPGSASPKLGRQFADDVRLTLRTRPSQAELAVR
jgi:hypothetical protein